MEIKNPVVHFRGLMEPCSGALLEDAQRYLASHPGGADMHVDGGKIRPVQVYIYGRGKIL